MEYKENKSELETLQDRIYQLEKELSYYKEYRMLDKETLSWLAENIDSDKYSNEEEIKDMLRNQIAVSYLLIFPILEQRQFSGFMRESQIEAAAGLIEKHYDDNKNGLRSVLEPIIQRFFNRYHSPGVQEKRYLNDNLKKLSPKDTKLQNNPQKDKVDNKKLYALFTAKNYELLSTKQKIELILFVIYRYRNNIFHGNKSIKNWINYNEQIYDCLTGMMKIADCMRDNNIKIPGR